MGLIATRSFTEEVTGIKDLVAEHEKRIRNGMIAYDMLRRLRAGDQSEPVIRRFEQHKDDLGYGMLLKRYTDNVTDANDAMITRAARESIPRVAPVFWTFRLMVAAGVLMLIIFSLAMYFCARRQVRQRTWFLKLALWSIPLPWLAAEAGWFVAEYGRQPWSIGGVLPTALSTSTLEASDLWLSLAGFIGFYTLLLVAELYLMFRFARLGPSSLHTGRYDLEQSPEKQTQQGTATLADYQPQNRKLD
jgi:cytochrome d ubiquinol oxidase subunit I